MKICKLVLLTLLVCIIPLGSYAQTTTPYPACMTILKPSKRFCVGEEVEISNCINPPSSGSKFAKYSFGDGSPEISQNDAAINVKHIYNSPGTYTITQIGGQSQTGPQTATETVVIVEKGKKPSFEALGCEGNILNIKFTDNIYTSYFVSINTQPEQAVPATPDFRVNLANNNPISINVKSGECNENTSASFTPFASLVFPDVVNQIAETDFLGNNPIANITLNGTNIMRYKLEEFSTNSWIAIDTINGQNSNFTIKTPNLSANATSYYRISSFDACGASKSSTEIIIPDLSITAQNNQNILNWSSIDAASLNQIANIEILRNNVVIATLNNNETSYTDLNIVCGRNYTYRVRIVMNSNEVNRIMRSSSLPKSVNAISNNKPPAIKAFNASVEGKNIQLTWKIPNSTVSFYSIKRFENDVFSKENFSFSSSYLDNQVVPNSKRYCYLISYKDSCGNFADDSIKTCAVLFKTEKDKDDQHIHQWWSYKNESPNPHNYLLEIYDPNNKLISTINTSTDTNYVYAEVLLNLPSYRYRIAIPDLLDPNKKYFSNFTEIKNDIQIFVPDAFTPNNDDVNEIFKAEGKYLRDFKLSIFNRWGEQIFYSENIEMGWNGALNGTSAPDGLYSYTITAIDNSNQIFSKKGTFYLLK